ncbi:hypothetical protein CBS63078_1579 [Aspergillus niger]|nr:hypothetical protein CBS12448_9673 [Aspergillus niger]KAI2901474.1 hypothetical protein CBS13152_1780 [Aspergillus niger]KAI2931253.1 hypothetical protein CBS63078_1579 [Aspergillus niger]KAI2947782.1 hypothetical protein CBS147321_2869 [Aspergillus niger]KAI2980119.1 hypothetical protein CBS147324_205 [Aspergillus niger]
MNLTLILTLLATLVASIPADGSSFTDIYNPLCHKDSDCGTGCCYNGLCLAYCLHNEDDVHTELVRSLIDESLLRTEENLDITAPVCHTNRDCGTGCCYHGLCLAYCPNDMAKRGDGGATWGELSLFFGLFESPGRPPKCSRRTCKGGCCRKGLCVYCYMDKRDDLEDPIDAFGYDVDADAGFDVNVDADIFDDSDDEAQEPASEMMHKSESHTLPPHFELPLIKQPGYSMPDTDLLPTPADIIHTEGMCSKRTCKGCCWQNVCMAKCPRGERDEAVDDVEGSEETSLDLVDWNLPQVVCSRAAPCKVGCCWHGLCWGLCRWEDN